MTDQLTDNGILTDSNAISLLDYVDMHGPPVHVGADRVVFADSVGNELADWAEVLDITLDELHSTMHVLAREVYGRAEATGDGDPWSVDDPVVFDADTFRKDNFEALALLVRQGCSPAEALDWVATQELNWTQTDWGRWRRRSQQNISENVSGAREELKS